MTSDGELPEKSYWRLALKRARERASHYGIKESMDLRSTNPEYYYADYARGSRDQTTDIPRSINQNTSGNTLHYQEQAQSNEIINKDRIFEPFTSRIVGYNQLNDQLYTFLLFVFIIYLVLQIFIEVHELIPSLLPRKDHT